MLNIRVATPPWDRQNNKWMEVNPGICSSYVFSRKPGDKVTISGPYGEFHINPTQREIFQGGPSPRLSFSGANGAGDISLLSCLMR